MVQAWMDYRHHRDDIPAEASIQRWALCIQTRACKMIQEAVPPEETKQKHESSGSSSSAESPSPMKTGSPLETLEKARSLRAKQKKTVQVWIVEEGEGALYL